MVWAGISAMDPYIQVPIPTPLIFRSIGVEILGVLAEIGEFEGVLEN